MSDSVGLGYALRMLSRRSEDWGQAEDHGAPFVPPAIAVSDLEEVCGDLPRRRLFVVPATTHLVRNREVFTPTQVLAFGDRTVALWVGDVHFGRVSSIPVEQLLAVDDLAALLYGQLRLMSATGQLVVRYNTVSRDDLERNLRDLRRRIAITPAPIEERFVWLDPPRGSSPPIRPDLLNLPIRPDLLNLPIRPDLLNQPTLPKVEADLPHKWHVVLEYPNVQPDLLVPAAVAVGDVLADPLDASRPATGVAVLSSRELVIAIQPSEFLDGPHRYGVDVLAVPRDRLGSLRWDGRSLTIGIARQSTGERTSITLELDPYLVEAMAQAFGAAVMWA